jgi:hypothetical protein
LPSIGSVGDAYDNALMETITGLYKAECIRTRVLHDRPLRTITDVEHATARWVDWCNQRQATALLACSAQPSTSSPTTPPSTEASDPHRSGKKPGAVQTSSRRRV